MTEPSVDRGPTVLVNGTILTMDRSQPIAEWVAIEGSQILAVGCGAPPTVETVDLDGAVVLPGFHDAHVHPPIGGMAMIQCNLHPLATPDEYVAAVAAYAQAHPDEPWVLGGGWAMDDFPAGKAPAALLDAVVPDRPVLLRSSEGHASWANTKALEIAGVTAATPDPPDGRIERHADGSPFGTLQEGAAELVERCAPAPTVEDYVRAIASAQSMLLSLGVTSWQDAWVTPPVQAAYLQLDRAGRLVGSVQGALWWDRERNLDQIDELIERSKDGSSRFRPTSVKLMVDGVCENGTAAMRLPYEGGDSRGIQFIPRDVLVAAVPRLMAAGLQPHFHAIGDRAIGDALDAVAAGDPADVARVRPHIAHIQVIDPADVPRFAALGVAGNAQAFWACHDSCMTELTMPRLGERRTAMQYPFRSLLDAGARLAAGSDWSVSSANPFEQIRVAVMRSQPGQDKPFLPSEAITVGEMLAAFTVGSAWVNHAESYSGSIQPGKAADLIVADRNPLTIPPAELHLIEVRATYVAGLQVYRA